MKRDPSPFRRLRIGAFALAALLVSPILSPAFAGGEAAPATPSGPNILLIVTDDQRAAVRHDVGHAEDAGAVRG